MNQYLIFKNILKMEKGISFVYCDENENSLVTEETLISEKYQNLSLRKDKVKTFLSKKRNTKRYEIVQDSLLDEDDNKNSSNCFSKEKFWTGEVYLELYNCFLENNQEKILECRIKLSKFLYEYHLPNDYIDIIEKNKDIKS